MLPDSYHKAVSAKRRAEINAALTPDSLALFLELARDAANWSGTPPTWVTKEQRGNLTHLKKAGLLSTFEDRGDSFAVFTEAGVALAAEHGVDLSWIDFN